MRIYLAPMEGITTYIFRNAFYKYYGGVDKYFTPFLANKKLSSREKNEVLPENNKNICLVPQILTNQVDTFLSIAEKIREYGYTEVNFNLGCPSGTVVSRGRGAGFLGVPDKLDAFLYEIFEKCPLGISIKTRLGISELYEWEDLLTIYKKYPLKELVIHTRLQKEFYQGKTHPEAFETALSVLDVPLCYNGDIRSVDTFAGFSFVPDAVMLGRGLIADPRIAMLLREEFSERPRDASPDMEFSGQPQDASSPQDVELSGQPQGALSVLPERKKFRDFHDEILEKYIEIMPGERPVLFRMKELWVYMRSYLQLSDKQLKQLNKANSISDYRMIVNRLFSMES